MPGVAVHVDAADLRKLYLDLRHAKSQFSVELRRGIKEAAQPVVDGVKAEAGWSSRIPGAVQTKVSFGASPSVSVIVNPGKAPEAAPINHGDASGTFRHPVFGNRLNWVGQPARPFLVRGAMRGADAAQVKMLAVYDRIIKLAGGS